MQRHGQIEMIGLVILVVILIFGALFYVRFQMLQPVQSKQDDTLVTTQAYNLLSALLPLPLCEKRTIKDALIQCSEGISAPFCADYSSCQILHEQLPIILGSVLDHSLGLKYSFHARSENAVFFEIPGCTRGITPSYPFQESGKNYEIVLTLCKN